MLRLTTAFLLVLLALCTAHKPSHLSLVNVPAIIPLQSGSSTVKITVSSYLLQTSGQFVNVSYSGYSAPSSSEWIGLYLEGEAVNEVSPISYQLASYDENYLKTGNGMLTFQLLNLRSNMILYFFTGGLSSGVVIAQSDVIVVVNVNEPLQGRLSLSLTNDPSQMYITWTTKNCTSPSLKYGNASGIYSTTVIAQHTSTYSSSQMCGPPATTVGYRDPGLFHTAQFNNLLPNQRIYYRFGDISTNTWSEEHSFVSSPEVGGDVSIIAFGDLGQAPVDDTTEQSTEISSLNTTKAIASNMNNFTLILHVGDISYARGYSSQWEYFHNQIEEISTSLPWMVGIGNHERDWPGTKSVRGGDDSGGECGIAYESRFFMPSQQFDQPWYSFDYGVLHIIVISTEHAFTFETPQHRFVVNDLASINRTATPWVIFAGHRPFLIDSTNWNPDNGDQTVAIELRLAFEELLFEHKVDLIFGAHHHSYQRTCPVYHGECMSVDSSGYAAPVIVNLGMAGYESTTNIEPTKPDIFVIVSDTTHGYMTLVANSTALTMQYVEGLDANIMDSFTLVK